MAKVWLALALTVTALGLAACGDDDEDNAAPAAEESNAAAENGGTTGTQDSQPIVIRTHVVFVKNPTPELGARGEILPGSTLGDAAFCTGGAFSDGRGQPPLGSVVKTIRCSDGRLTITFSPQGSGPNDLKQSSSWRVVNGTGSYGGLTGGGQFEGVFEPGGAQGRETFTGNVTP